MRVPAISANPGVNPSSTIAAQAERRVDPIAPVAPVVPFSSPAALRLPIVEVRHTTADGRPA
ncbi:hypothetical protein C5E41_32140 [Nocardia nova]|nr:hypothetical protein C5E41_32140 [Nocardia nova]